MLNAFGGILWLRQRILCFVTEVLLGDSRFTDRTHRSTYTSSQSWHLVCARNHSGDFVSRRCARGRDVSGLLQRHTTAQAVPVCSPQVLRLWPCINVSRRITPCHAVNLFWHIFASPSDGLYLTRTPHFPENARTADRDMRSSHESSQGCGAHCFSSA
jgi:hypothetical protein